MSKPTHTPGPWAIDNDGETPNAIVTSTHYEDRDEDVCEVYGEDDETRKANARLIAAAPRLLEALQRMAFAFGHGIEEARILQPTALDIARDAIIEATGSPAPTTTPPAAPSTDLLDAVKSARDVLARLEGEVLGYGVKEALRKAERAITQAATQPPTIFVALNDGARTVKVHVPRSLGAAVEFLDCDEPDWPGLKARGIPHPTEESAALERDPAYQTHTENL